MTAEHIQKKFKHFFGSVIDEANLNKCMFFQTDRNNYTRSQVQTIINKDFQMSVAEKEVMKKYV